MCVESNFSCRHFKSWLKKSFHRAVVVRITPDTSGSCFDSFVLHLFSSYIYVVILYFPFLSGQINVC